jgi:hypothetical protein
MHTKFWNITQHIVLIEVYKFHSIYFSDQFPEISFIIILPALHKLYSCKRGVNETNNVNVAKEPVCSNAYTKNAKIHCEILHKMWT